MPNTKRDPPPLAFKQTSGGYQSRKIMKLKTLAERCGDDEKAKPGSERYNTFRMYRDGMTVAQFLKKGGTLEHLRRDVKWGHITLVLVSNSNRRPTKNRRSAKKRK